MEKKNAQSLSEKGSDPLEASRFHWFLDRAGEGQTPFRIGSPPIGHDSPLLHLRQPKKWSSHLFFVGAPREVSKNRAKD